jgi:hypothetical protein
MLEVTPLVTVSNKLLYQSLEIVASAAAVALSVVVIIRQHSLATFGQMWLFAMPSSLLAFLVVLTIEILIARGGVNEIKKHVQFGWVAAAICVCLFPMGSYYWVMFLTSFRISSENGQLALVLLVLLPSLLCMHFGIRSLNYGRRDNSVMLTIVGLADIAVSLIIAPFVLVGMAMQING